MAQDNGREREAPAHEQFISRWSPRAMTGQALSQEQLFSIFEAGRWAPSCFNSQPWRFVYGLRGTPEWDPLFNLIMDMNQVWAREAGALVAVVSKVTFDHNGEPAPTHSFDTGSAWMSMALQAEHLGLVSHAMWGFHHDQAADVLGLTEDYATQAMVAFGYPGDPANLPEKYQEREKPSPRKTLSEIAFPGRLAD
ncbi:MAG: nitroreductase family protein [Pseudomonadota bacterium]